MKKDVGMAYILFLLIPGLAVHKFYLEKPWQAILFILTFGGLGIWWLIDLFTLPGQVKKYNMKNTVQS